MTKGQMSMFGSLLTYQARVIHRQTRIMTGEYLKRNISRGGFQLSDEKKLEDEFNIIERHIDKMQEITDNFHETDLKER